MENLRKGGLKERKKSVINHEIMFTLSRWGYNSLKAAKRTALDREERVEPPVDLA